eukprot:1195189-Prorocentrum_minimum.AAC.1
MLPVTSTSSADETSASYVMTSLSGINDVVLFDDAATRVSSSFGRCGTIDDVHVDDGVDNASHDESDVVLL